MIKEAGQVVSGCSRGSMPIKSTGSIGAVRAFLEVFQSSLLNRKVANDLLITYIKAEVVILFG